MKRDSILAIASLLTSSSLFAATWTGAQDGSWTNAANWAEGTVPGRYYLPTGELTGSTGDTATFDASGAAGAHVIDFDGVYSIGTILVTGAGAPQYTFGTSSVQFIPIEEAGAFQIAADAAEMPVLTGWLAMSTDGVTNWPSNSSIVNDNVQELVVNGFGSERKGNGGLLGLQLKGSGPIRFKGPYVKGTTGLSSGSVRLSLLRGGGTIVFDMDLSAYDFFNNGSTGATELEVPAGRTLALSAPSPVTVQGKNHSFAGEGELRLTASGANVRLTVWSGLTLTCDVKVTTPNLTADRYFDLYCNGIFIFNNPANEITGNLSTAPFNGSAQWTLTAVGADFGVKGHAGTIGNGDTLALCRGCLRYTGAGETMDRDIKSTAATLDVAGYNNEEMQFDQKGTGVWRIESEILSTATATPFLRLKGNAKVPGVWASVIPNGSDSANLSLIKSDVGTWRLEAVNTYTGTTTIEAGVLELGPEASISDSPELVFKGGTLDVSESASDRTVALEKINLVSGSSKLCIGCGASVVVDEIVRTSGTLDVEITELPASLTVKGLAAGALPAWLTVNGGTGTVDAGGNIISDGTFVWKENASGKWSDGDKWSPSVPAADGTALVTRRGDSYEVEIGGTAAAKTLKVKNAADGETATVKIVDGGRYDASAGSVDLEKGAILTVAAGGKYLSDNSGFHAIGDSSPILTVAAGGRFAVDGGEVVFTNSVGALDVGGDTTHPGVLCVTNGGAFHLATRERERGVSGGNSALNILEGGRLEASGDSVVDFVNNVSDKSAICLNGGTIDFSGNAVLRGSHGPTTTLDDKGNPYSIACRLDIRKGEAVFRDNAALDMNYGASDMNLYVYPSEAGDTATLTFRDHAVFDHSRGGNKYGYITVGRNGRGILNFESDVTHPMNGGSQTAYRICVGSLRGYGEMNVSAGTVIPGSYGLFLATKLEAGVSYDVDTCVTGVVRVTGGTLNVQGSAAINPSWGAGLYGTCVGDGTGAFAKRQNLLYGRLEVSGGTFVNDSGYFLVGYGRGEGDVLQTGGEMNVNTDLGGRYSYGNEWLYKTNNPAGVGLAGGTGRLVVSNGTFTIGSRLFVGGVRTNEFVNLRGTLNDYANQNIGYDDRHDAHGTLAVAGGTFTAHNPVIVGADGSGTVEIGPSGTFTAPALVLSNQTASVARFVFGADGLGAATVKKLVIAAGAKLEVDLSAYAGGRSKRLIAAESVEGAFAESDITVTGTGSRPELKGSYVVQDGQGIRLRVPRGMLMVVR